MKPTIPALFALAILAACGTDTSQHGDKCCDPVHSSGPLMNECDQYDPSCDAQDPGPDPVPATLNPAFNGAWTGNVLAEDVSAQYAATLTTHVSGTSVSFSGVCPDGTGGATAVGSGDSASWSGGSGSIECTVPAATCPQHVVYYTGAVLSLANGQLVVRFSSECGDRLFNASYVGTRIGY